MKKKIKVLMVGFLCVCLMLTLSTGCAQDEEEAAVYPEGPITLIVNYGGGGGTDLTARAIAKAAEEHLGVPISVVNKTGGVGTTGIVEMLNKKPDGYSVGIVTYSPIAIVPHQMEVPYTPDDFKYICAYGIYKYGLAVKNDSPYETVEELIEAAKESEKGLSYGASGYPQPFVYEKLSKLEGAKFIHIPTQSGTETNTVLLGGHVESVVAIMSDLMPFVESGEMRILASASSDRLDIAPDVPTLVEQGYGVEINSYMGIAVHKDVSDEKVEVLREAFAKAFEDEEFQDIMKKSKIPAKFISGEDYGQLCKDGYKESEEVMREMGVID